MLFVREILLNISYSIYNNRLTIVFKNLQHKLILMRLLNKTHNYTEWDTQDKFSRGKLIA